MIDERRTAQRPPAIPFDTAKLDAILDRAGIDALIVSSKHNIQYLLGGYRFFFFEHFDAIGIGRSSAAAGLSAARPCRTLALSATDGTLGKRADASGCRTCKLQPGIGGFDAASPSPISVGSRLASKRIGVGARSFPPMPRRCCTAFDLPHAELVEALPVLEKLQAVKSPAEPISSARRRTVSST